jgi:hypothetical protein
MISDQRSLDVFKFHNFARRAVIQAVIQAVIRAVVTEQPFKSLIPRTRPVRGAAYYTESGKCCDNILRAAYTRCKMWKDLPTPSWHIKQNTQGYANDPNDPCPAPTHKPAYF